MPRPLTGELGLAAQAERSEFVHLLEFIFSTGTIRMTTGAQDLTTEPYAVRIGATTSRYLIRNPVEAPWPDTELTVEFWGRLDSGLNLAQPNFAFSYGVAGQFNEVLLGLQSVSSTWRLYFERGGVGSTQDAEAYPNDNAWHHVVMTWRSSDGATSIYLDGVLVHTGTVASGNPIDAGGVVVLGQEQDALGGSFDATQAWKGELDGVRVYRRVLSATEVAEHFNGRFANEQKLVALWTFDKFGSVASNLGLDSGPIGNHLTVNGITAPASPGATTKTWSAVGGLLRFGGVEEAGDPRGQGMDVQLSGVTQTAIAVLLGGTTYRGRQARIWRAHLDQQTGLVVDEPLLLLEGLQLAPYEVQEDRDSRTGGTVTVRTRIKGRMGIERLRGIWSNLTSHQHVFPGDTFFRHVVQLANSRVHWGVAFPRVGGGGGGGFSDSGGGNRPNEDRPEDAI